MTGSGVRVHCTDYSTTGLLRAVPNQDVEWHSQHAPALISLKYFPDHIRQHCMGNDAAKTLWTMFFPDLKSAGPSFSNRERTELFDRLADFRVHTPPRPSEC